LSELKAELRLTRILRSKTHNPSSPIGVLSINPRSNLLQKQEAEENMLKISRYVYMVSAWLFLLGVVTQVYLAGMVVVARRSTWNDHIDLGHSLAGPLLLMLISMYLGKQPGTSKAINLVVIRGLCTAGRCINLHGCQCTCPCCISSRFSPGRFCAWVEFSTACLAFGSTSSGAGTCSHRTQSINLPPLKTRTRLEFHCRVPSISTVY
jgi:hypothetical protein